MIASSSPLTWLPSVMVTSTVAPRRSLAASGRHADKMITHKAEIKSDFFMSPYNSTLKTFTLNRIAGLAPLAGAKIGRN